MSPDNIVKRTTIEMKTLDLPFDEEILTQTSLPSLLISSRAPLSRIAGNK